MGRYDDVDPDALRAHLVRIARLILRLEQEGALLREAPRLQKVLGDLRQRLFAYEVRRASPPGDAEEGQGSDEEAADEDEAALVDESLRIVREAMRRTEELREELEDGSTDDDNDDEDA